MAYWAVSLAVAVALPLMLVTPLALAYARGGIVEIRKVWTYNEDPSLMGEHAVGTGRAGEVEKEETGEKQLELGA